MRKPTIYTINIAVGCFIAAALSGVLLVVCCISSEWELAIIFGAFVLLSLILAVPLLVSGLKRRKNRVVGEHGERKIIVEHLGSVIEVYNISTALSAVNYITLVINNVVADHYGGLANSVLYGEIQTPDGEKSIRLESNNLIGTLRLYRNDVLLAKKFIFFG